MPAFFSWPDVICHKSFPLHVMLKACPTPVGWLRPEILCPSHHRYATHRDSIKWLLSFFGNLKGKAEKYLISDEIDLEAVKNTKSLNNGLYYYKAFIGDNSVNAENRYVLIVAGQTKIYSAGEFSEIDKKSKFFTFVLSTMGKAHSMDKYEKKELILKNNKLVLK